MGETAGGRLEKIRRIVWALDPFEEPGPIRDNLITTLRSLVRRTGATVTPIHVFSVADVQIPPEVAPSVADSYLESAKAALSRLTAEARIPGCQEGRVLFEALASKARAAEAIAEFAVENDADLIVAGTHGRSGIPRFLLGSFAESLVLRSHVPVMVVSRRPLKEEGGLSVLYATDLGQYSRRLYEATVHLAHGMGAELTVFHSVPNPVEPVFQSGVFLLGGAWVPVHPYFAQDNDQRQKKMEAWRKYAEDHGVVSHLKLVTEPGSIAGHLLQAVDDVHADLIVLAPHGGRWAAALAGSIVRQVARHTEAPLLILHGGEARQKRVSSGAA